MIHSIHRTFLVFCLLVLISSCAHSPLPFVAKGLKRVPGSQKDNECSSNTSCLQIFIMYGEFSCAHTALRVQINENKTVFWDPAGGYGIAGSVNAVRVKDLVISPVPTVSEYLEFRSVIPTEAAEIFEFEIERRDAEYLYNVLSQSSKESDPEASYDTQGVGLFCSYHVSEFLEKFAGRVLSVKQVFFPHSLAKQLYTQRPNRVLVVQFSNGNYDISITATLKN